MRKSKHTPGPWTAYDAAAYGTSIKHGSMTGQCIAAVHLYQGLSVETYAANVRLIAAAPELLEALEHLAAIAGTGLLHRQSLDKQGMVELFEEARAAARAAIAKATGGDQ